MRYFMSHVQKVMLMKLCLTLLAIYILDNHAGVGEWVSWLLMHRHCILFIIVLVLKHKRNVFNNISYLPEWLSGNTKDFYEGDVSSILGKNYALALHFINNSTCIKT